MSKISVLMPTYRPQEEHLREALEGLLEQTETDWECIICDEPTETNTVSLLAPYLGDERITLHKNEKRLGIGGNWNRCLSYATSPVIAYLFQDDLWERDYLETGMKIFHEHQNVDFISMGHSYQYEGTVNREGYEALRQFKKDHVAHGMHDGKKFLEWWTQQELHPNIIGEPPFVILRKELTDRVGPFHEEMPQFLDVEYWIRCLMQGNVFYEVLPHGTFRVHGDAASAHNDQSGAGIYDRLRCFEKLIAIVDAERKPLAIASRNSALEKMVSKFFDRIKERKGVKGKGTGHMKTFCLKHPLLVFVTLVKVLLKRLIGL